MKLAASNPEVNFSQNDVVIPKEGGLCMLVEGYEPETGSVTCICFKGGCLTRSKHPASQLFLLHRSPKQPDLTLVSKKRAKKIK